MLRKFQVLLPLLAFLILPSQAKEEQGDSLSIQIFRPYLIVQGMGEANREDFHRLGTSFKAAYPITGGLEISKKGVDLKNVYLTGQVSGKSVGVSEWSSSRTLLQSNLSALGFVYYPKKDLYVGALGVSFSEEDETLSDLVPQVYGFGLYGTHRDDDWIWLMGGAYAYSLGGKGLPLPLLGFRAKLNDAQALSVLLPVSVKFDHSFEDRSWKLSGFARLGGERARIANRGDFDSDLDRLLFRHGALLLGAGLNYRVDLDWSVTSELGFGLGNRDTFLAGQDEISTQMGRASGFFTLGVKYAIGEAMIDADI